MFRVQLSPLVEASWFCEQNSDWDSWRIQLPSGPSWDYLKNHGMCDISSTVISSMSSLVLELWHSMSLCTVWRCPRDDSLIWRISWKMTQFWTATGKETISINILVETGWFYEQNSKQSYWRIPHSSASQTKFSPEKLKKNILLWKNFV